MYTITCFSCANIERIYFPARNYAYDAMSPIDWRLLSTALNKIHLGTHKAILHLNVRTN